MTQSASDALSQDVVFDILSNARRRFVLYYLRQAGRPVELGELAQQLAAWENDTDVESITSQQRKRVYVSLYQTHIQKLQSAGIVEYDSETGMVALSDRANQLGAYLAIDEDEREAPIRWQEFYLGLAVLSALFYAAVALDVWIFALVSEFQAGLLIVAAFAVAAIVHYLYTRRSEPDIPTEVLIGGP